jgi:hypothetical protein
LSIVIKEAKRKYYDTTIKKNQAINAKLPGISLRNYPINRNLKLIFKN